MGLIDLVNSVTEISNILDGDSYNPSLLDLFFFSDAIICSTMAFLSLGNSNHIVLGSTDFLSNSKLDEVTATGLEPRTT